MTRRVLCWCLGALALLWLAATPTWPQVAATEPLPSPLAEWQADVERAEKSLLREGLDETALDALREELEQLRRKMAEYAARLGQQHAAVRSQLDKLGPAPKAEQPAESEAAAKLRKNLTEQTAQLDGQVRAANVLQTRAAQLSTAVHERRRDLFSRTLFKRGRNPLNPNLWAGVASDLKVAARQLAMVVGDWWNGLKRPRLAFGILAAAMAGWLALRIAGTAIIAHYRNNGRRQALPFLQRTASAAAVAFARAMPAIVAAGILFGGLALFDMLPGHMGRLALAAFTAISTAAAAMALVRTILAPGQPRWRIVPVSDESANRLRWLAWGVATVFVIDLFLAELSRVLITPIPLTVAQSFIATVLFAGMLAVMLATPLRQTASKGAEQATPLKLELLRGLVWLLIGTMLVAAALGYIAFARFLAKQVVVSGSLLALGYLLHLTIEAFCESFADPKSRAGRWLGAHGLTESNRAVQMGLAASILLHLPLLAALVLLVLLQWGFAWVDLRAWMSNAFFGFQFGDWRISISTILIALLVFLTGLLVTRIAQRWLDVGVLERGRFNQGARNAIRTGVGYLGVAIAVLIAISYAGVDFTNLALVAGALGVGIGFGLQSIVNNFVSGLILLAERRIAVGDWIVVGNEEGYVRRISVRATEIETFDRNFVILPNSELISNTVKNWTYHHRRARVQIEVGVAYDTDPELVRKVLTECALQNPLVSRTLRTSVWFEDFGDSALIFRLKTFVDNIDNLLEVRSELRYAIMKAFREHGIEIPYPQRDLHLKDIDRLEKALAGRVTARKRTRPPGGSKRKPAR